MARDDRDLLEEIKERFKDCEEADSEFREQFKRDTRFRYGEQWDDQEIRKRKERGRPCLTFNRVNPTIRSITNEQRINAPSPEVVPVDDHGDVKTAEVIQGMIRYILNCSNSKAAFSTAYEHATTGGRGYYRILTEYESHDTFNQDIKIKEIINQGSVFFDPYSTEIDGSDAEYAFISDEMSLDKYKRLFGDTKLASFDSFPSTDNPFVLNEKSVRIAEYFYKEYADKTLLLLSNGMAVFEDELDRDALFRDQLTVIEGRSRKVKVPSVKWCKTNGIEILEKTDWPGKWIPIIPVYGERYYLDGKVRYHGMVKDARDPQMAFNALTSAEIEAIALAPKAPWLVTAANIKGYKNIWDRSNENLPYLPFEPDPSGHVPIRQSVEPAIAAITQASLQMADNVKVVTGVYDAGLGAQGNETSGIAIQRRTMQGQTANYHYQDHLNISLSFCGRQLVDLIPKVYDATRAVRILGNEDEIKTVIVNSEAPDNDGLIYNLQAGKYDVRIQTGPSYLSKRQEAAASMVEVAKTNPQIAGVAGDLMVKAMDWPHSQEIAERLKRTIPPHVLGEEGQGQVPPEVQAQIAQMDQMIAALTEELKTAKSDIEKQRMKIESDERIARLKAEIDLIKEWYKADSADAREALRANLQEIQMQQNLERERALAQERINQTPVGPVNQGARGGAINQQQQPTGGFSPGTFIGE